MGPGAVAQTGLASGILPPLGVAYCVQGNPELVLAVLARRGLDSAVLGILEVRSSVVAFPWLGSGFLGPHGLHNVTKLRNVIDQRWLFGAVDAQKCDGGHGRF